MNRDQIGSSHPPGRSGETDRDRDPKNPLPVGETLLMSEKPSSFPQVEGVSIEISPRESQSVVEDSSKLPVADDAGLGGEHADKNANATTVDARLQSYFAPDAVPIVAFVKALRKAKIRRFDPDDIRVAEGSIAENDKEGSRLWQLVAHASSLGPISAWGWPFIQNRINILVGVQVDLSREPPNRILDNVLTAISGAVLKGDRQHAKRAENDLRLAIAWLLERRNADVTDIAARVHPILVGTEGDVEGRVRRAVSVGSKAELQAAVNALRLVKDQIRIAKRERDVERRERFDLKGTVDGLREKIARDDELIRRLKGDNAELERQLESERIKAESDRRHYAHSSSQSQADVSTSLQRVKGLVIEAGEAVQIAMKRADERSLRGLQAAERRISSAIDAITGISN